MSHRSIASMSKRSSARTSRKKYVVDAFEGIDELRDEISQHGDAEIHHEVDDSADDFQATGQDSAEDDAMSGVDTTIAGDENSASDDDDEDTLNDSASELDDAPQSSRSRKKRKVQSATNLPQVFTRALPQSHGTSKKSRLLAWAGPSLSDTQPLINSLRKWERQQTFPTRQPDRAGMGGFSTSLFKNDEDIETESTASWKWYFDGIGKVSFNQRQVFTSILSDQADEFMLSDLTSNRQFLLGPVDQPTSYQLAPGEFMPLKDAWSKSEDSVHKSGFVLNFGARVRCLEWQPNHSKSHQYLAVSVQPDRPTNHDAFESPTAPAFSPQHPFKSNIQIWRFCANEEQFVDVSTPPGLSIVLCTSWGDVKALKWCPSVPKSSNGVGLLAGIWGDGAIRVLDIPSLSSGDNGTQYISIEKAAFEVHPPNTLCTSLTWIDSSTIAAGCANGCLAVWDLVQSLSSQLPNPRPQIYASISTSYITTIISCAPSRPSIILTTSMTGYTAATDISRPQPASHSATALSRRSRTGPSHFVWSDFAQAAIVLDDSHFLRALPLRRLFNTVQVGKINAISTAMATSPCHPCLLIGTTNGEVCATNPLQRTVNRKANKWQLRWFAHEWRRATQSELSDDAGDLKVGPAGISRIVEGFKPQKVTFGNNDDTQNHAKDGGLLMTIYEEKTAISALAWNPNMHVGGWAAAGMADGLVRVEDVAT